MYTIYAIKNVCSGRVYIGSTVDVARRKSTHFNHLRKGVHKNRTLQRDFNKFGERIFIFNEITKAPNKEIALRFEQILMDGYANNYNILPKAGKAAGRVHIQTTKDKMSAAAKGRVITEEQKEVLRKRNLGKKQSVETIRKRAETMKKKRELGQVNNKSTLKEYQVLAILEALELGFDREFLAEVFGVTKSGIGHIAQGLTWKRTRAKYEKAKREAV